MRSSAALYVSKL